MIKVYKDEVFEAVIGNSKYKMYMKDGVRRTVDESVELVDRPKKQIIKKTAKKDEDK